MPAKDLKSYELLTAFLNRQNNQGSGNHKQSTKYVKSSHNVCDVIHNYSFDTVKLKVQENNDRKNPEIIKNQLAVPKIIGSTSIEAKNTCPISRRISENIFNFAEENTIYFKYNLE